MPAIDATLKQSAVKVFLKAERATLIRDRLKVATVGVIMDVRFALCWVRCCGEAVDRQS